MKNLCTWINSHYPPVPVPVYEKKTLLLLSPVNIREGEWMHYQNIYRGSLAVELRKAGDMNAGSGKFTLSSQI